ncbi:hypothetical protein [Streptomyces sviceus]|uniref:hypothetical protein n=1 Tax=Streptomyces sviceus TaxID=285530 RepID=UPI003327A4A3
MNPVIQWVTADILHLFVCLCLVMLGVLAYLMNVDSGPSPVEVARKRAADDRANAGRRAEEQVREAEALTRQCLLAAQRDGQDVAEAARRFTRLYVEAKRQARHD